MPPASYSPDDILLEISYTRMALERAELHEMSDALANVKVALYEFVRQSKAFAQKYGYSRNLRDHASPRLLFFMGIT